MNRKEKMVKVGTFLVDILIDMVSGLLIGIALYNFAADALFPMTGVSGIAMIFYHYFGLPIGTMSLVLNIPIIIFCYKPLGKKFLMRSFKTMLIGTVMMDFVAPLLPKYQCNETILTALVVAVLTGFSYAIIYIRNSSTGGADFVIMAIKAINPHISLGNIFFLVDVAVIVLGTLTYGNFEGMLYGLLISYVASKVVDRVMISADLGMMTLVVTDKAKELSDAICAELDRGATIFNATGGYSGDDKQVVMCACSTKQMVQINRMAKQIDPRAFMVIMESKEVYGEGFKRFK